MKPLFRSLPLFLSLPWALSLSTPCARAQDDHDHDHDEHAEVEAAEHVEDGHDAHGHEEHDAHDLRLAPSEMEAFGIRVAVAGPGELHEFLRLPGEIRSNEHAVAHVGPRYAGIARAVHKRLGDRVTAGEVLAEMESNETLRPFSLVAPIDGTIVDFHLTLGESLEAGEYAYVVADTSSVWADLRVYQRDLPQLRVGQPVHLSAGHEYPDFHGTVTYLGPVVEETTRTGLARVVLENPEGLLRPGLFVIGEIVVDESDYAVVVPLSALLSVEGNTVVFVETDHGEFAPRPVVTGHRDEHRVEIVEGLSTGEEYVVEGGFFLKAEAGKAHFGDGHAH